jgi:DNA-binding NarL/FixJ family response regulator
MLTSMSEWTSVLLRMALGSDVLTFRPERAPAPEHALPPQLGEVDGGAGRISWVTRDRPRDDGPVSAIRVLVADDHPVVRRGLTSLLGTLDDFEVVGEAIDGDSAVRETQLLRPDVVLMDVRMPGSDGVEATRRIRTAVPETAVLILTMHDDDATVFTAMRAGARGYLLKGAEQDEIAGAIRAVAAGQAIFGPGIAARLLDHFAASATSAAVVEPFPELTPRELEVLRLLADGRRTADIAMSLHLSPKTVSNNLTTIFAKLQVDDRTAAVIKARERGLGG